MNDIPINDILKNDFIVTPVGTLFYWHLAGHGLFVHGPFYTEDAAKWDAEKYLSDAVNRAISR